MSVGQSKSLRAHQHKMNTKIGRAKTVVEELKARNFGKGRHRHKYEVLTSTIKQGIIIGQTCRCTECGIVRVESDPKTTVVSVPESSSGRGPSLHDESLSGPSVSEGK